MSVEERELVSQYGDVQVKELSPETFVDAAHYLTVDDSGQPAEFRERDPLRFVLMAALAYGVSLPSELLRNKKVFDVGCGGGQVSECMALFAKAVWLCDPDLSEVSNPARNRIDSRFLLSVKVQDALRIVPELSGFYDLVTSFAPHPFPLGLDGKFTEEMRAQSLQYFASLVDACKPGGDLIIMPIYVEDLGLKGGLTELLSLLEASFKSVIIKKVTMPEPQKMPYFSVFVVAKAKEQVMLA